MFTHPRSLSFSFAERPCRSLDMCCAPGKPVCDATAHEHRLFARDVDALLLSGVPDGDPLAATYPTGQPAPTSTTPAAWFTLGRFVAAQQITHVPGYTDRLTFTTVPAGHPDGHPHVDTVLVAADDQTFRTLILDDARADLCRHWAYRAATAGNRALEDADYDAGRVADMGPALVRMLWVFVNHGTQLRDRHPSEPAADRAAFCCEAATVDAVLDWVEAVGLLHAALGVQTAAAHVAAADPMLRLPQIAAVAHAAAA